MIYYPDWHTFLEAAAANGGGRHCLSALLTRAPMRRVVDNQPMQQDQDAVIDLTAVQIFLVTTTGTVVSPPRDWSTRAAALADYQALAAVGALFVDSEIVLAEANHDQT